MSIKDKPKSLSIVVPVYNEEETLPHTHDELKKLSEDPRLAELTFFEVLYVDDGSEDRSGEILRGLRTPDEEQGFVTRSLHFSRNFGHSAAVLAGLEAARGEAIAILDADLQDPPSAIPSMLEKIAEGWDVVYGQRVSREGEGFSKRTTAWVFYRLLRLLSGMDIPKDTGDFRVMTREVRDAVIRCGEREPFLRGLISWVGFRQLAFPYVRQGRRYGETKYPFRKMFRFASWAILGFSLFPLKLSLYSGAFGLMAALGLAVWATFDKYFGYTVPGWTSLLVGFMFGQSITLLLVGVIGIYVGKVHMETQGRPRYILRR